MAFIAAGLRVEQFPAALGRFINGILISSDEVIERGVERYESSLVGGDGTQQIRAVERAAKDLLECLLVFLDSGELANFTRR